MRQYVITLMVTVCFLLLSVGAFSAPDKYIGDTAIYSGDNTSIQPNVLFIVDNSPAMKQSGGVAPYNSTIVNSATLDVYPIYNSPKLPYGLYELISETSATPNYTTLTKIPDVRTMLCPEAKDALLNTGYYPGGINKQTGACSTKKTDDGKYYMGNLINYIANPPMAASWEPSTYYPVGTKIVVPVPDGTDYIRDSNGVVITYECIRFKPNADSIFKSASSVQAWTPDPTTGEVVDGQLIWKKTGSIIDTVKTVLSQLVDYVSADKKAKMGLMIYGGNDGGDIVKPIRYIDNTITNLPNKTELITAIEGIALNTGNHKPLNKAMYDASYYFRGDNGNNLKFSSDKTVYPLPIEFYCQRNFVVLLTTGADNSIIDEVGDLTGDGFSGYVDDVAKWINTFDHDTSTTSKDSVQTFVVQLMTSEVTRLKEAANLYGRYDEKDTIEHYYLATGGSDLAEKLKQVFDGIVKEADTSFVAPVVPASTTNRTISSNRVYLGLFKPISQSAWQGNLKKYKVSTQNELLDVNYNAATYSCKGESNDTPGCDTDLTYDGEFIPSSKSYWGANSTGSIQSDKGSLPVTGTYDQSGDGGIVPAGGVGGTLQLRLTNGKADLTTGVADSAKTARDIFTWLDSTPDAAPTYTKTSFSTTTMNSAILNVVDATEKDKLVNYIQGYDAYDDNGDSITDVPRPWVMGDILHSKPLIFNYSQYLESEEDSCTKNTSMIYVGANDGMLHAFRDCDGEEEWAFIPDILLPYLKELREPTHTYFVDGPPSAYVHDTNSNGIIEENQGDVVLLLFGMRRGGGMNLLNADSAPRGAYYALDVSAPLAPKLLWKIDSNTSGFEQLGEAWTQPRLAKINDNGVTKVVAFVGGGYDNNEDLRYGDNQQFPATTLATDVNLASLGAGDEVSSGTSPQFNPRGHAMYAFEVATLKKEIDNVDPTKYEPTIPTSATRVWGFTAADDSEMTYSFPSDLTVLDMNADGFHDRIYVGDTGGRMWRFDIGASDLNWTGKIIFSVNPGSESPETNGRKIFYKPVVTLAAGYPMLFFGTGDREHPLNRNLVDRLYAIKDRGQNSSVIIGETDLSDVTLNRLQASDASDIEIAAIEAALGDGNKYGWYIRLNDNPGEKSLAPAVVFNSEVFFTTYSPNVLTAPDPCESGNLGVSRLYRLDMITGEAVYNYNKINDIASTYDNKRAINKDDKVLNRDDRVMELGKGIPSGIVTMIDAGGNITLMVTSSNKIGAYSAPDTKLISPVYWMNW